VRSDGVHEIPARDALYLQVAAIAGAEPSSSFVEIRTLVPDGWPGPREFVPVRDLRRAVAAVWRLRDRHEVLLGAAPRVCGAGTADAVERVWALRVDCDNEQSVAVLARFKPAPAIVARTGTSKNVHAWWPLREPLSPSWARAACRRLAYALRSDLSVGDPSRVMRAIGSLNHKHAQPRPVVCVRLELDVFTCDQVVGGLPDPPERHPRPPREQPSSTVTANAARVLEGLKRTVREAQQGNRNHALHWASCRLREHGEGRLLDVAGARAVLHEAALDAGLREHEIRQTLASGLGGRATP
jgi:hypothetical protein